MTVDILSAPCDCCGKNFPVDSEPPYEVTVRYHGGKALLQRKDRLCSDCFEALKMEFERLKNL